MLSTLANATPAGRAAVAAEIRDRARVAWAAAEGFREQSKCNEAAMMRAFEIAFERLVEDLGPIADALATVANERARTEAALAKIVERAGGSRPDPLAEPEPNAAPDALAEKPKPGHGRFVTAQGDPVDVPLDANGNVRVVVHAAVGVVPSPNLRAVLERDLGLRWKGASRIWSGRVSGDRLASLSAIADEVARIDFEPPGATK